MTPVLSISDLRVRLRGPDPSALVIDGLSLEVRRGEVVALVGESGSGKTMTAYSVLRLLPPAIQLVGGVIRLGGQDVVRMEPRRLREVRGKLASIIFQEPMTSLNPLMTIER